MLLLAISITLFQISCSKQANAQTGTGSSSASLILYGTPNDAAGDLWIANSDGTNQHKIHISFPSGYGDNGDMEGIFLSSDKQKIFFTIENQTNDNWDIFSCSIDGSNVTKLISNVGVPGLYDVK